MGYFSKGKHRRGHVKRIENAASTDTGILDKVAEIIEETCGVDRDLVTPAKRIERDLDIDDLTMIEVIVGCEYAFDMIRTPIQTIDSFQTIKDLIDHITIYQGSLVRQ